MCTWHRIYKCVCMCFFFSLSCVFVLFNVLQKVDAFVQCNAHFLYALVEWMQGERNSIYVRCLTIAASITTYISWASATVFNPESNSMQSTVYEMFNCIHFAVFKQCALIFGVKIRLEINRIAGNSNDFERYYVCCCIFAFFLFVYEFRTKSCEIRKTFSRNGVSEMRVDCTQFRASQVHFSWFDQKNMDKYKYISCELAAPFTSDSL